jgi:hypothetical protein
MEWGLDLKIRVWQYNIVLSTSSCRLAISSPRAVGTRKEKERLPGLLTYATQLTPRRSSGMRTLQQASADDERDPEVTTRYLVCRASLRS